MKTSTYHQIVGALVCAGREDLAEKIHRARQAKLAKLPLEKQAKTWLKMYPNQKAYLKAQKGIIYLDSLGRKTKWEGREHEVRNAEYEYKAKRQRALQILKAS